MSTIQSENLPWVEKYRPKKLEDLISHEDILKTIRQFMVEDRLPHLLFYGPPGTGKTSTILACARQLYKPKEFNSMVLELNASDDRGIDVVRNQVGESVFCFKHIRHDWLISLQINVNSWLHYCLFIHTYVTLLELNIVLAQISTENITSLLWIIIVGLIV